MISKGLVAFVTGGASGLGKATVQRLVKEGNKVVICDLPSSSGSELANGLGPDTKFVAADVTNTEEVEKALQITKDTFGSLNVVVNCAGTSCSFRTYNFLKKTYHSLDDFKRILEVNAVGTFNVIRLSCPYLAENEPDIENQKGLIINTSSFAATNGISGQVAYAASKGAIDGMLLPLAKDLGSEGIRVCSIAPGTFDTPLLSPLPEGVKIFLSRSVIFPNRIGKPEEFASLVKHIIENPFINATTIRIDAGFNII